MSGRHEPRHPKTSRRCVVQPVWIFFCYRRNRYRCNTLCEWTVQLIQDLVWKTVSTFLTGSCGWKPTHYWEICIRHPLEGPGTFFYFCLNFEQLFLGRFLGGLLGWASSSSDDMVDGHLSQLHKYLYILLYILYVNYYIDRESWPRGNIVTHQEAT